MSVGDWSAKIWFEELKSPIIRTRYHGAYLTDGCFSPTRPGVFFLSRKVNKKTLKFLIKYISIKIYLNCKH